MGRTPYPVLEPKLQISFYYRLQTIRRLHLSDALRTTVAHLSVQEIVDPEKAIRGPAAPAWADSAR